MKPPHNQQRDILALFNGMPIPPKGIPQKDKFVVYDGQCYQDNGIKIGHQKTASVTWAMFNVEIFPCYIAEENCFLAARFLRNRSLQLATEIEKEISTRCHFFFYSHDGNRDIATMLSEHIAYGGVTADWSKSIAKAALADFEDTEVVRQYITLNKVV